MVKVNVRGYNLEYKDCYAFLGVSIGSTPLEGEKLKETLIWLRSKFNKAGLIIADSLQRYNLMAFNNMTEQEALEETRRLSKMYISSHKNLLHGLDLIYWDDLRKISGFEEMRTAFRECYASNSQFRTVVDGDIQGYIARRSLPFDDQEKQHQYCLEYIFEELAIDTLLARKENTVAIYPGTQMPTYKALRQQLIAGAPKGLELQPFCKVEYKRTSELDKEQQRAA
ncbi:MAG: tRNA-dependent cyclodipeptide synthase [Dongiaceae bacterium]